MGEQNKNPVKDKNTLNHLEREGTQIDLKVSDLILKVN